ncbi:hypothetical protein ACEWY4_008657 [Coilia grayii]|uniref:CARD domain-containing protein n=1 Tax=Coilia grayii TaxID=363190 RepID=A0ABD1KBG9_9TELE
MDEEILRDILDHLLAQNPPVLSNREAAEVLERNQVRQDQVSCLVDMVLKKGQGACGIMLDLLQQLDPHLYQDLHLEYYWSNTDACVPKTIEFLDFGEPLGITLIVISVFWALVTVVIVVNSPPASPPSGASPLCSCCEPVPQNSPGLPPRQLPLLLQLQSRA